MQTLTININNDQLLDKVLWLLEHFKKDGLEVMAKEDMEDLKILSQTRHEESIAFEDYLVNAS